MKKIVASLLLCSLPGFIHSAAAERHPRRQDRPRTRAEENTLALPSPTTGPLALVGTFAKEHPNAAAALAVGGGIAAVTTVGNATVRLGGAALRSAIDTLGAPLTLCTSIAAAAAVAQASGYDPLGSARSAIHGVAALLISPPHPLQHLARPLAARRTAYQSFECIDADTFNDVTIRFDAIEHSKLSFQRLVQRINNVDNVKLLQASLIAWNLFLQEQDILTPYHQVGMIDRTTQLYFSDKRAKVGRRIAHKNWILVSEDINPDYIFNFVRDQLNPFNSFVDSKKAAIFSDLLGKQVTAGTLTTSQEILAAIEEALT